MAYAVTQNTPAAGGFFARLNADIRERLERRRIYRQTVNELSVLSDRELGDLGIARSMIRGVAWQAAYDR
ncbi:MULTISPECIES: DUF1127 domain-containing protein [unclassified Roseivivax]|uniref:DUF1127 domain-containing protein n=1 Tax=Roseivivax sp. GX 12232 TaxID=2900547 RepID=UPI001E52B7B2|nr:DUF1127 domain-containing protein [Roseivivax sp. GX 12232]MCE0503853.1 DUF1127 domain-containing protein [Roseivivax sp. GX 12232]